MKRAVLIVGPAGVGKSTLINILSGKGEAVVSHSMWDDGTAKLTSIEDVADKDLVYIDTPGLNSATYKVCLTEVFQHDYADKKVLVVLVLSTQTARVQDFIETFDRVVDNLIGNDKMFFIVWTHSDEKTPRSVDVAGVFKRYGSRARVFCDSSIPSDIKGISALKEAFSVEDLFCTLKVNKAPAQSASVPLAASPVLAPAVNPLKGAKASVALKCHIPVTFPLGFPLCIAFIGHFKVKPQRKGALEKCIADVLEVKKTSALSYQAMKLLGDAAGKMFVYNCFYASGEREWIETNSKRLLDNGDDCAMPLFFDKYIADAHKKKFENEVMSAHGKADVVEALIEYARRHTTRDYADALKFIIREMFRLVGMGGVIKA
jgi:energy-coupling factor transporter ATP-binding protein EcfA2